MRYILKNASIITHGNNTITVDVCIENGMIKSMGSHLDGDRILDLGGKLLMPGLVDVHVHLREPGFTDKETIQSGSWAAAKGGFTTIAAMPNLNPVPDTKETYQAILDIIKNDAIVNVLQYAPITKGLRSKELVDMEDLDAFAYTNDGVGVQDAGTMYQAMVEAKRLNKAIVAHTEDESILYGGVMHEGIRNKELGYPGILSAVESSQIARDVILAQASGVHYHICHVSSKESLEAIRMGKRIGANVTSEVSPHHLLLSEMDIKGNDGAFKMNPPLRSEADRKALVAGLLDGTLDFIATDHAPHTKEEKAQGFKGPFGIIGLEAAFPLMYTEFVEKGIFTLENLKDWMSLKPQEVFNIKGCQLNIGDVADLAVFDLEREVVMDLEFFKSKSSNTPFLNKRVKGSCVLSIVRGEIVWNAL